MRYPKINTLWKRDEQTHKIIKDDLSLQEFAIPQKWIVSEKVDGTNVRVILRQSVEKSGNNLVSASLVEGHREFHGKTDDAMLHPALLERLKQLFPVMKLHEVFPDASEVILFGEGYGSKVNGIKGYGVEAAFNNGVQKAMMVDISKLSRECSTFVLSVKKVKLWKDIRPEIVDGKEKNFELEFV